MHLLADVKQINKRKSKTNKYGPSTIIVREIINAPSAKVWKAITDKNEMTSWYFDLEEFKPEVGFKFSFTGGPSPKNIYVHLVK